VIAFAVVAACIIVFPGKMNYLYVCVYLQAFLILSTTTNLFVPIVRAESDYQIDELKTWFRELAAINDCSHDLPVTSSLDDVRVAVFCDASMTGGAFSICRSINDANYVISESAWFWSPSEASAHSNTRELKSL
jgi:hypothetical protein